MPDAWGASAGPRTPEGLERCRKANWKHGKRSAQWIAERRQARHEMRVLRSQNAQLARDLRACIRAQKRRQNPEQGAPLITPVHVGFALREAHESVTDWGPELLDIAFNPCASMSPEVRKVDDCDIALRVRRHLEALDARKQRAVQEDKDVRVASLMKAETTLLSLLTKLAGLI